MSFVEPINPSSDDVRANKLRHKFNELVQVHLTLEEKQAGLNNAIEVRYSEILRLSKLYQINYVYQGG